MMSAAPKPCTPRAKIRADGLSTSEHASDPEANTARPATRQPRRPSRSPVFPAISRKLAKMIV
jgi:hypothetical protein